MENVFRNTEALIAEKKLMEKYYIPSIILMENAGAKSAEIIWNYFVNKKCTRIVILTGKGNNAGDGFVIARHLFTKNIDNEVYFPISIFQCYPEEELKGDALINYNIVKELFISDFYEITNDTERLNSIIDNESEKTLFVDAVFGIGFKGKLDEKVVRIFSDIMQYADRKFIIAIDTPSGLDNYISAEDCLKADVTISMGVRKLNTLFYEGREASGDIKVVDIGLPNDKFEDFNEEEIYWFEKEDTILEETVRNINSHKYNNGKLFILAGSEGFSGAAYLCAQSALRAGCGAVILGIPEGLNTILETKTTEVITLPLKSDKYLTNESYDKIAEKVEWCDSILLGPGIGREGDTMSFVRNLYKKYDKNFVIDADGLYAFKGHTEYLKKETNKTIITPHFGEFANLLNIGTEDLKKDFINTAKIFAKEHNLTLVLKNSPTIITNGDYVYINSIGKENLATIGSGDVLSGIIGSLFAQTKNTNIASSGVYLHSYCGDLFYEKYGNSGTTAEDLVGIIPYAKNEILISYNI